MSTCIKQRFEALKSEGRAGLVTFIMAGDPGIKASQDILNALPKAGADIIEIGMPFSDPMADGPTIQAAGKRALDAGITLKDILSMVKEFRQTEAKTPIILMGYYNPVYHYGVEKFCADAAAAGADGMILVDLPPEEEAEFKPHAAKSGLDLIRLIAPTSDDTRLPRLCQSASGFVYYISITGITGAAAAAATNLRAHVSHLREYTSLPVAVGFGIKTPAQVAEVAAFADAVVVGTALVDIIGRSNGNVDEASRFVRSLAEALPAAGKRAAVS